MRGEFIDLGGTRLYYYAAGTRGAGNPVLLLHGFATSAHLWKQVIPRVPTGHRVIALDLAGHGRSEPTRGGEFPASAHARAVEGLLDELRAGAVHVVAHGFGCEIALALARAEERVLTLLLMSPGGDGQPPAGVPTIDSTVTAALRLPWAEPAMRLLQRYLSRGYTSPATAVRSLERHLQWFRVRSRRTALARQLRAAHARASAVDGLSQPLEIVTGANDPFTTARSVAKRFPQAQLTVLDGERHFIPEEAPDSLARLLSRLLSR